MFSPKQLFASFRYALKGLAYIWQNEQNFRVQVGIALAVIAAMIAFRVSLGQAIVLMLLIIFVQGIYQLVIHTELIPKLGLLESIFVTPSIHRVHHGCNEIYIDKNYGKVFIFWDKIFNTYQPETEKVIYGIKDINSNKNIFNCLFDNYIDIYSVLNQKIAIKSKLKFLFNKPGNKL